MRMPSLPRGLACVVLIGAAACCVAVPAGAADLRLIEAVKHRDGAAVSALLKSGHADTREADGATALHWASHLGDRAIVEQLLHASADPNAVNEYGVTPLMLAAEN